jgi:uncharacterized protein (DUF2141 family)
MSNPLPRILPSRAAAATLLLLSCTTAVSAPSASIQVQVLGVESENGEIGCALFHSAEGFPMSPERAITRWHPPGKGSATCHFEDLEPGSYAVAVSHDVNANRRTDTNLLGIPVEQWGVSNNVRPTLRAPRFDEAAVTQRDGEELQLTLRTAK